MKVQFDLNHMGFNDYIRLISEMSCSADNDINYSLKAKTLENEAFVDDNY